MPDTTPAGPQPADLLITHGVVITVDPRRRIFADGAVAIAGGAILEVGQSADLERRYAPARTLDVAGGVVHPGFVDCHVHLSQHLGRSTIPDSWSNEEEHRQWFPYWTNMTEEDAYWSAMLACLEMVRNGTTAFCDNGGRFAGELNASVAERVGLRGMIGEVCWDRPPEPEVSLGDADDCLARLERLLAALPFRPDRLTWAGVGMAGMGACSDRLLAEGKRLADRAGVVMDMHQSYAADDTEAYRRQTGGKPAVQHLADLGVLGPNLQLVHMGYAGRDEIPPLVEHGVSVVHCPGASVRMGIGISHAGCFPEMAAAGVNLALGSDSGNYSDFFDVGRQMYLAATIHREARRQVPAISAEQTVEMATLNGARSLGMAARFGSLEAGKRADVTIHAYRRPEWRPGMDPITSLVYSAQSTGVDTVIVDGRIILEAGQFTQVDEEEMYRQIDRAARRLYGRMGFPIPHRWPVV